MSGLFFGHVWNLDLPPLEKLVLLAFADHADDLGNNVRPGIVRIAAKTGLKQRTVQAYVSQLRERGFLVPSRYASGGRGHVTEYRIDLHPPPLKGAPDCLKGAPPCTPILRSQEIPKNQSGSGSESGSPRSASAREDKDLGWCFAQCFGRGRGRRHHP